jgi:antitoxin (DNA-binding transcriptional repressor) of toxin-antitoxin stability system
MYVVHVKRVTASEARRNWFRLLDEVAAGETVVIERDGRRVVLRREPARPKGVAPAVPDYSRLLRVPNADRLDRWSWEWTGPGEELLPSARPRR